MKTLFKPKVNPSREFLEIASDFSNPLDIVREAISNSFDAKASEIFITFSMSLESGRRKLKILLRDNGTGMDYKGVESFFDLGNSLRKDDKVSDPSLIGEKGHGTKIYFNSERIVVITGKDEIKYSCCMNNPIGSLYEGIVPDVEVEESQGKFKGTLIEIIGYNNNERDVFTHDRLRDYIYWFTKYGSFEGELGQHPYKDIQLHLQGIDRNNHETLKFGHKFAEESESLDKLMNDHITDAPDYFVKKFVFEDNLRRYPDISYQAVWYIEGNKAKRLVNNMIKRSGYQAPSGGYSVQERYGIWLSKDYIPVQQKNEWINKRGSESTKLHAFFNCQDFRLTANRGSVENTSGDILEEIKNTINEQYLRITESDDWSNMEWLEEQSQSYQSERKEEKDFEKRAKLIKTAKIAEYKDITLREPRQEQGVFSIYHIINILEPQLFPFEIVDYDTHAGIDVLARLRNSGVDLERSYLRFVEFKNILKSNFNHSFKRLYGIVCWNLQIVHDEVVTDAFGHSRKLRCVPSSSESTFTQYFLEDERDPHRIEIIVLEEYLEERLGIQFKRVRT
ncbi:ATP-binding protein [Paenibacillus sp. FA6]|uniref:ATP-binding protein n=1 Tax=Paenibacillus sp. FA6 TaxID=3413029 RepID=UPI003F65EE0D